MDLTGKNIVLGVCGGIAAFKACEVASRLTKLGANVDCVLTANAARFVAPLTFSTLTHNAAVCGDMFEPPKEYEIGHVSLAQKADLLLICPATANTIAKIALGIADDFLSTTALAINAERIMLAPAMNSRMYQNPAFAANLNTVLQRGAKLVEPASGLLACGESGIGRLAEVDTIIGAVAAFFTKKSDFAGKKVLVTAGGTEEPLDGVRFITNRSSGKMGCEIAKEAHVRGAIVTLVLGIHTPQNLPENIKIINVSTTQEMFNAVLDNLPAQDIIIKAAAPCDFRPETVAPQKIKAKDITVKFVPNPDIAKAAGEKKGARKLVIFAAETENLEQNAAGKLRAKNADLVVANDVTKQGAGFGTDTNIVTLIDKAGAQTLPQMSKRQVAAAILDKLLTI